MWAERAGTSAALTLLSVSLLESHGWAVLRAHLLHTSCAEGLDSGYNYLALPIRKVETLTSFFFILYFIFTREGFCLSVCMSVHHQKRVSDT